MPCNSLRPSTSRTLPFALIINDSHSRLTALSLYFLHRKVMDEREEKGLNLLALGTFSRASDICSAILMVHESRWWRYTRIIDTLYPEDHYDLDSRRKKTAQRASSLRGLRSHRRYEYWRVRLCCACKIDIWALTLSTFTHSLIALMLGRLRMSVDDAIQAYAKLSKKVFSQTKNGLAPDGRYKASNLEDAVKTIIKEHGDDTKVEIVDSRSGDGVCSTYVPKSYISFL